MKVLVTGGAGFVGSHVVDELLARGIEVRILDPLLPAAHRSAPDYLPPGAEFINGDLRDPAVVRAAIDGVDHVSHQAAMVGLGVDLADAPEYVAINDLGTAVLLAELARAGFSGRFVLASSMVVYGEGAYECAAHGPVRPEPRAAESLVAGRFEPACPDCGGDLTPTRIDEDAPLDPRNVYAATKLHQEHLVNVFARETGATATSLRYHNVYGPRMPRDTPYAGVASIFRSAVENDRAPEVFEDGRQLRDFVHVKDVARANVLALLSEAPVSGALNIATGIPRSIGDLARTLAGGEASPQPVISGRFRLGDVRHVFASPERAERKLGFRAEISFEDGMKRFLTDPLRA